MPMAGLQINEMSQGLHVFCMKSIEAGRPISCEKKKKKQAILGTLELQDFSSNSLLCIYYMNI